MTAQETPGRGELEDAIVVDFPVRGERWVAVTSPADRIPSHGVDMLGQRYAFDLLIVDERPGIHFHPAGTLRGALIGGRTSECYAWGAPVLAPYSGVVVGSADGATERAWIHPARELVVALRNALTFRPSRLGAVMGNHVILRRDDGVHAAFAHLRPGSVTVTTGQVVGAGEVLGQVGHTGNSTAPHLHFQLMDSADPLTARGIPCAFRAYEVLRGDRWVRVERGVPGKDDRIRSVEAA